MSAAEFEFWEELPADNLVVNAQPKTAIFLNGMGQVVIRQETQSDDELDAFVIFNGCELPAVVAALARFLPQRDSVTTPNVTDTDPVTPESRAVTPAALRQRRRRARQVAAETEPELLEAAQ